MAIHAHRRRLVAVPDWLSKYRKDWLRPDVLAGLVTSAVVMPKAMAYATIAGLPVQVELYTAFLPMAIYGLSAGLSIRVLPDRPFIRARQHKSTSRRSRAVAAQDGNK
jgi:hypothetical protein